MTNSNIVHTVLERKNATQTMLIGIYSGLVALFVCLIGMVETFGERDIIGGIISMGHTMLIVIAMGGGAPQKRPHKLMEGAGPRAQDFPGTGRWEAGCCKIL